MAKNLAGIFYLIATMFSAISMFLHARITRSDAATSNYENLKGEVLKHKSAWVNGRHYGLMMEYKLGKACLGVRCYFPRFDIVEKYDHIRLSKSKALIGSLVKMEMPSYFGEIEISHRLAKKLDRLSGGKFGYKNIREPLRKEWRRYFRP